MESEEDKTVKFAGHENQISSIVRLCREGGIFTDAELICDDGIIPVHRLVLGSVSEYLCSLLTEVSSSAILLPGVRMEVAHQLVQFIYSGLMQLSQLNSWEVQELVTLLRIDPSNVVVDVLDKPDNLNVTEHLSMKVMPKKDAQKPPGSQISNLTAAKEKKAGVGRPRRTSVRRSSGRERTTSHRSTEDGGGRSSSRHSSSDRSTSHKRRKSDDRSTSQNRRMSGDEHNRRKSADRSLSSSRLKLDGGRWSKGRGRRPSDGGDKLIMDSPVTSPKTSSPRSAMLSPRRSWSSSQSPRRSGSSSRSPRRAGSIALSPRRSGPSPRSGGVGGRYRATSGRSGAGDPTVSSSGEFMSVLRPSENSNVIKIVTSRKRHLSQEGTSHNSKDARHDTVRGRGRGKGGVLRCRGRGGRGSGSPRVLKREDTGNHDMENVETWVCAICGRYDPILTGAGDTNTTEWIGCDCNRWFHKFCTKLKVVDDTFCCKLVQKTCLPH